MAGQNTTNVAASLLWVALGAFVGCHHLEPVAPPTASQAVLVPGQAAQGQLAPTPMMGPVMPGTVMPGPAMSGPAPMFAAPTLVAPGGQPPAGEELPGWFEVLPRGGGPIASEFGLPEDALPPGALPNPLPAPVTNHDYAWEQIAEVVSDYFPIQSERRVHVDNGILTEGRIETPYQIGATIFELQRNDSVGAFNLWQSTLQTIRRRATLRVIPNGQGYLVDVKVIKELEDLPRPERASAGSAVLRFDSSLPSDHIEQVSRTRMSDYWVPLGRDFALEQKMLGDIQERLVPSSATAAR